MFQENGALEYIAIGDSLTVGVGIPLFESGFVEMYKYYAQKHMQKRVVIHKYAQTGATTGEVIDILNSTCVQQSVKKADMITITAGGNDMIDAAKRYLLEENKEILVAALKTSIQNLHTMVRTVDQFIQECEGPFIVRISNLYNPFPHERLMDKWINVYNHELQKITSHPTIKVVDLYSIFKNNETELLSNDGIHPNKKGYEMIASTLDQLSYEPLTRLDD
ncbi:GDSL-type esterase/lipase family protein [Bacillus salitolerans]|uniref:GDSL-type esterase/lipase family protein n=1 Tax=Bacillus salitolerans TaxID=1437434 RepID=A0ABW4LXJ0_9BACI